MAWASYPACSVSISAMVGVSSGMADVDHGAIVFMCCMPSRNGKRAVIRAERVGLQTGCT